jgi:uncharacterized DUF497 family protein
MSSPRIEDFLFDEENEEEITTHGLSIFQVLQILENISIIVPNRKYRRGVYLIVGRDNGGKCISSPIEPTYKAGLWRPITAWPSKKGEETELVRREKYER